VTRNATTRTDPDLRALLLALALALATLGLPGRLPAAGAETSRPRGSGFAYQHDEVADKPWSIHVLKVERNRPDLIFQTTIARSNSLGLSTLSEQLKALPRSLGTPLAAVNGDFWREGRQFDGDPMGLQIRAGELISAPVNRPCLWFDNAGQPQLGTVQSGLSVTWPDGRTTPFGLNEERTNGGAVLYTAATGASTRTRGGREIILERDGDTPWLPLQAGRKLSARVRAVRPEGDTPLAADVLVLSLSPTLAESLPAPAPGALLRLATATTPDLGGVTTALGGGPTLVRDGQAVAFSGSQPRHPRTAVGWNDSHLFLVVVDGRQLKLSVGMSLPELAAYMLKLGCQQALNLDGGGSSTFWVHGQVMNSPCYGKERSMANALVLVRRPANAGTSPAPPRP
jgi:hypothetical protein